MLITIIMLLITMRILGSHFVKVINFLKCIDFTIVFVTLLYHMNMDFIVKDIVIQHQ
jgi:hypothetical protein